MGFVELTNNAHFKNLRFLKDLKFCVLKFLQIVIKILFRGL